MPMFFVLFVPFQPRTTTQRAGRGALKVAAGAIWPFCAAYLTWSQHEIALKA
jgi:hypothetical protein